MVKEGEITKQSKTNRLIIYIAYMSIPLSYSF